jgi:hypothetical protein
VVAVRTGRSQISRLGYGLDGVGFEFQLRQEIFSSPEPSDGLRSPLNLLFHRYRRSFSESAVLTHLYLSPRLRMSGALPLLPVNAYMEWKRTTLLCFTFSTRFNAKYCLFFHHTLCVRRMILRTSSVSSGNIRHLFVPMEAFCVVSEVQTESSYILMIYLVFRVATTLSKPAIAYVGILLQ